MDEQTVICADMDAFFASVEQRADPRLRGRPAAVTGSGGRTVVTTASYEARALGVKTGMSLREARRACPGVIFVVGNNARYTHTCRVLADLYRRYTPEVEVYSVDEAFLDVTTTWHLFGAPEDIGREIKAEVRRLFGINCTVGIGPNVLLAKLASDLAKPDGLLRIRPWDVARVLGPLPVGELWGIGPREAGRLSALGIRTCGELGRAPASLLRDRFGIRGEALKAMGQGLCNRRVDPIEGEAKSIGHSMTLPVDINDRREMEAYLLLLSGNVGERVRRHGYMGRTVSLALRYSDFETILRQKTLGHLSNDTHDIYSGAVGVLGSLRLRARVRLLGVSLSSLVRNHGHFHLLESGRRRRALLGAMDDVNDRYGGGP